MYSQHVAYQMNGTFKVKHPNLIPLFHQARQLAAHIPHLTITQIPREMNREADRIAKESEKIKRSY